MMMLSKKPVRLSDGSIVYNVVVSDFDVSDGERAYGEIELHAVGEVHAERLIEALRVAFTDCTIEEVEIQELELPA